MSYPGSKGQAGTWQRIIGQIPPHDIYVEPFFGSGQVFHRKRPAAVSVAIDADAGVLHEHCPFDRMTNAIPIRLAPGVTAIARNALEVLPVLCCYNEAWLTRTSVIYCDPPYPLGTRNGRRYYAHELTDDDHAALLATLLQAKCRVLISGVPCPLYSSQLKEWRCLSYWTMTRGGKRRECLWCNFPEPEILHDWRFAGANFRQRCAFNRIRRNMLTKLEAMSPRKRGFVLDAIAQRNSERWRIPTAAVNAESCATVRSAEPCAASWQTAPRAESCATRGNGR